MSMRTRVVSLVSAVVLAAGVVAGTGPAAAAAPGTQAPAATPAAVHASLPAVANPADAPVGSVFVPLPTTRVYDSGTASVGTTPVGVQIAGKAGIPADATAVVVNTEVYQPTAAGYVRVTPYGQDAGVAVQEFVRGQTISNLVIVKLAGGKIQTKVSAGKARILMDVSGYYTTTAAAGAAPVGSVFVPLPTTRVYDSGTASVGTTPVGVQIAGKAGIPANATAVVVNTEVYQPTAAGYVRVTPYGQDAGVAVQEFVKGQTISNLVIVKLAGGKIQTKVSAGKARILMDVSGYYVAQPSAGSTFTWDSPQQIGQPTGGGAVSCASASFCVAVDLGGNAMTYNGTTWTKPTIVDPGGWLNTVSCPTSTFCVAFDLRDNVLIYNGATWTKPSPTSLSGYGLSEVSVSCASTDFCAAVGDNDVQYSRGYAITYNGATWSAPTEVTPGGGLDSVSCPTSTFCAAIDWGGNALTYNGTTWTKPTPTGQPLLSRTAVSCASAAFCVAVNGLGYAVTYNGTTWGTPTSIDIDGNDNGTGLNSVSCPTANFCAAVDGAGNAVTYNGTTWTKPSTIDTGTTLPGGGLKSVSCPTEDFCAAVSENGTAVIGHRA